MLRMNFISLPVTNSADGGRRSCPNAIKPLVSAPYSAGGSGCGPWCLSPPPVGECCPLVGMPPSATTVPNSFFVPIHVFVSCCLGTYSCQTCFPLWFLFLLCMNSNVMTDVILMMGIRMQNNKCNEVENAFPIVKLSRLVRVHTDSHQMVITKWFLLFPTCDK